MLKFAGALLIVASLFLPLSSCSGRFVGPRGETVNFVNEKGQPMPDSVMEPGKPMPPGISGLNDASPVPQGCRFERHYHYFLREFDRRQTFHWVTLEGFLGPLALVLALAAARGRAWEKWLQALEPVQVNLSACIWTWCIVVNRPESGFWVALAGLALFGLAAAQGFLARTGPRWPALLGRLRLSPRVGTALVFAAIPAVALGLRFLTPFG